MAGAGKPPPGRDSAQTVEILDADFIWAGARPGQRAGLLGIAIPGGFTAPGRHRAAGDRTGRIGGAALDAFQALAVGRGSTRGKAGSAAKCFELFLRKNPFELLVMTAADQSHFGLGLPDFDAFGADGGFIHLFGAGEFVHFLAQVADFFGELALFVAGFGGDFLHFGTLLVGESRGAIRSAGGVAVTAGAGAFLGAWIARAGTVGIGALLGHDGGAGHKGRAHE